jgi:hypothetical protein
MADAYTHEIGFSSQNDDRAFGVYYPRATFYCVFCGQKDSMQKIFTKQFPFYGRKCLSYKTAHKWADNHGKNLADKQFETEARKWLRQQFKRLSRCWFCLTGKAMGQMYRCWWKICREINVFFSR